MSTVEEAREVVRERRFNSFNPRGYWEDRIEEVCRVGVLDAAAFLDEHIPGWHERITKPLDMGSVHDCVLGQVFAQQPGKRRLFGLLPPKFEYPSPGYSRGVVFLMDRGFSRPFVFSSEKAVPYWGAEITRRSR